MSFVWPQPEERKANSTETAARAARSWRVMIANSFMALAGQGRERRPVLATERRLTPRNGRRSSILVCAEDAAVLADDQLIPDHLADRILDEPDAAVAEADVDAAGMERA